MGSGFAARSPISKPIITHPLTMYKKYFRNVPLYLLTAVNIIQGFRIGFDWFMVLALIPAVIVILWDIWEVITHGNKRH